MARLLFFGRLADIAGGAERDMPLSPAIGTLTQLREFLAKENSALGEALERPNIRAAINKALAPLRGDFPISDADEIAFMPPLSGG
ncbi:MAG: MoaD/ThiS family protein [Caulobacterales bacterium]